MRISHLDGVNHSGDEHCKDNITVEIAPLSYGATHYSGAGRGEGALLQVIARVEAYISWGQATYLEKEESVVIISNEEEIFVSDERAARSKSKSKPTEEERQSSETEIRKVLYQNVRNIFASHRSSLNKTEASL